MKINIRLVFVIIILFYFQNGNAQSWYPDKPTPAEVEARDKPFSILQNEIETKLCDNDWGINKQTFLFYKDYPKLNEVLRGTGVHYFDLVIWGNRCDVELKSTSPLFTDYVNNSKILSERLDSIQNSAPTMSQAYNDVKNNKGVLSAKDKALLEKKKIAKGKCVNAMTQLAHKNKLANFFLFTNADYGSTSELGWKGFDIDKVNEVKYISIPGAQQVLVGITYPEEDNPDTTYTAQVFIGNWPKLEHIKTPFPFKYKTKTAWIDKAHSGPPIIENLRIRIATYNYDKIMKAIRSIDWTKLEALVKE